MIANNLMFRPLPAWAFALSFIFPLTIAFAELPTYFGYCMPRLEAQLKNGWLAWLIASFFLAAQHMFLPLILNGGYLLWRFGMFLPFALFTVLGDSAWVLGSVLLLVLPFFNFTTDAKWAIGITAICVDFFATIQFLEWRKQR